MVFYHPHLPIVLSANLSPCEFRANLFSLFLRLLLRIFKDHIKSYLQIWMKEIVGTEVTDYYHINRSGKALWWLISGLLLGLTQKYVGTSRRSWRYLMKGLEIELIVKERWRIVINSRMNDMFENKGLKS